MELVTFDLDGTLITSTVFQAAGRELGHGPWIDFVDDLYERGVVSLRTAFYAEYPLFLGTPIELVHEALEAGDWLADIGSTVEALRDRVLQVWVVTDQPDWAVEYLQRYGIEDGVFTRTTRWQGETIGAAVDIAFEKRPALLERLEREGIEPGDVAHVGNGLNDVPVFDAVGRGVAFNPSAPDVAEAADATIEAESLAPVLEALEL